MKTGKRFMSIFLSLIILISLCSGSAFAAGEDEKSLPEENNEEWIITEMSALDEAVMNQTVPQLVEGSEQTEPVLPETLEAMAYQMEEEPQAVQVEDHLDSGVGIRSESSRGVYLYTYVSGEICTCRWSGSS